MNMKEEKVSKDVSMSSYLFPGASATFSSLSSSESHCIGALNIAHENDLEQVGYLSLEGYRSHYPNIQRGFPLIRRTTISYVEIIGNCCWELYIDKKFKGEKQVITPGGNIIYPDFQPLSIKRLECLT